MSSRKERALGRDNAPRLALSVPPHVLALAVSRIGERLAVETCWLLSPRSAATSGRNEITDESDCGSDVLGHLVPPRGVLCGAEYSDLVGASFSDLVGPRSRRGTGAPQAVGMNPAATSPMRLSCWDPPRVGRRRNRGPSLPSPACSTLCHTAVCARRLAEGLWTSARRRRWTTSERRARVSVLVCADRRAASRRMVDFEVIVGVSRRG
jgi:hypothetical protein